MGKDSLPLRTLGISHGSVVYLLYHFHREVSPAVKYSDFEKRPFGSHMTVEAMVAAQTRIERQEKPTCSSVSFDAYAANTFQSYIQSALAFSIKRGGLLYGTCNEESGEVQVHAIYEPPQHGSPDHLELERGLEEERNADMIAAALGWRKVGWIFNGSTKERDFIFSAEEVCQMAAIQDEMGEHAITGVAALFPPEDVADDGVSSSSAVPEVHLEAFQVSAQCVKLWKEGWFQLDATAPPSNMITVRNPKDPRDKTPVIVSRKDVGEVDVDYFLVPVGIKDHQSPLHHGFPIENRLLPQGQAELRSHLQRLGRSERERSDGRKYTDLISDFHLLLFLSRQPGFGSSDVLALVNCVRNGEPIPDGYRVLIDSLAGL